MVYRPLSGSGTRHQAGVRLPHLEGHPGIELRKVLALLCMPRNQAPCGLQVVDSSLLMQGLAQPLERLYLCWPHSQQASAAKQAPLEICAGNCTIRRYNPKGPHSQQGPCSKAGTLE